MIFDPWKDRECIQDFIEDNRKDFESYLYEVHSQPSYIPNALDYYFNYLKHREKSFEEFAYNWKEEYTEGRAEKSFELNKDK